MKKKVVLSIAGSDSSGGAGIQADLATISSFGLYGETVITAVTAQNTLGVQHMTAMTAECIGGQIDSVFTDIIPDAVKIGMLPSSAAVQVVAEKLKQYGCGPGAGQIPVVLDPVIVSTSGYTLLPDDALAALIDSLFPYASIITPNLPEHRLLCSTRGRSFSAVYPPESVILIKGGHGTGGICTDTAFFQAKKDGNRLSVQFTAPRIANPHTHGTGCTLSSALACGLALKMPLEKSIESAKAYITSCIAAGLSIGNGRGPLAHVVKYS